MRASVGLAAALVAPVAAPAVAAPPAAPEPTKVDTRSGDDDHRADDSRADDNRADDNRADDDAPLPADERIVIEGYAPQDPLSPASRRVDAATLASTPRRSADDLLRLVPGLHVAQHAAEGKAQQFFLRGFDAVHGSDVQVRVGGLPVNEPSNVHGHGYVDIGFAIPEVVAQVTARSGSFSLDQSDFATAGTIDFELGVAAPSRGTRVTYEAGTTNRHRALALVAPRDAPEASFAAVEAVSDDGFGGNRASQRASALAQHRVYDDGLVAIDATAGAYTARFGEPGVTPAALVDDGQLDFYDAVTGDGSGSSSRALALVRGRHHGDRLRAEAEVYGQWRQLQLVENFTGFLAFPEQGDARDQRHDASTVGAGARAVQRLTPGIEIVAAVNARSDWLVQSEHQVDDAGALWRTNRDVAAWLGAAGAGLALRMRQGPASAEVGGRVDALLVAATERAAEAPMARERSFSSLSPRARVAIDVARGWVAFAGYGHGFRSPEARAVAAGDMADFTTSKSVESGIDARPRDDLRLTATGFATWVSGEVVFDHVAGTSLLRNATRRLGAELAVAATPVPWLRLRADVTAVDARFTESGAPVPGAPTALGRGQVRATLGRWTATALVTAMAPRPLDHGARGRAFAVIDALGGYRGDRYAVTLQLDNVLDSQWREAEYHFASRFDPEAPPSQLPRLHYAPGRPLGARLSLTARF